VTLEERGLRCGGVGVFSGVGGNGGTGTGTAVVEMTLRKIA